MASGLWLEISLCEVSVNLWLLLVPGGKSQGHQPVADRKKQEGIDKPS